MRSALLGLEVSVYEPRPGEVSAETSDGVQYLPSEIKKLQAVSAEVDPAVHAIKKLFGGTIDTVRNLTAQEIWVRNKYGNQGE